MQCRACPHPPWCKSRFLIQCFDSLDGLSAPLKTERSWIDTTSKHLSRDTPMSGLTGQVVWWFESISRDQFFESIVQLDRT